MPHEETVVLEVGAIWVPFTCKPAIMWAVEVHYVDFILERIDEGKREIWS